MKGQVYVEYRRLGLNLKKLIVLPVKYSKKL